MSRKCRRADALDGYTVPHLAAQRRIRISLVGIVGGPSGDDRNAMLFCQRFCNDARELCCSGSVRRVVLVENQNVHGRFSTTSERSFELEIREIMSRGAPASARMLHLHLVPPFDAGGNFPSPTRPCASGENNRGLLPGGRQSAHYR